MICQRTFHNDLLGFSISCPQYLQSVDEIQLHRPISIDRDATVTGQVVWTGSSSLDIQMMLWQEPEDKLGSNNNAPSTMTLSGSDPSGNTPSLVALFSFVHLDPVSKRPAPVVQLTPVLER